MSSYGTRRRYVGRGRPSGKTTLVVAAVVVVVVAVIVWAMVAFNKTHHVVATVTGKDDVCHGGSGHRCQYLVYTNMGTFRDTDSWAHWKFNSSDVYGQIQVGHTYDFEVYGIRSHIASKYENIVKVTEVAGSTPAPSSPTTVSPVPQATVTVTAAP